MGVHLNDTIARRKLHVLLNVEDILHMCDSLIEEGIKNLPRYGNTQPANSATTKVKIQISFDELIELR